MTCYVLLHYTCENQYIISIPQPNTNKYCGTNDFFTKDQIEQIRAKNPKGANIFTPNINQLSQSKPKGLPEQRPDAGNAHTTTVRNSIDSASSNHAMILSIQISDSYTQRIYSVEICVSA
jgi:hypothetical protein